MPSFRALPGRLTADEMPWLGGLDLEMGRVRNFVTSKAGLTALRRPPPKRHNHAPVRHWAAGCGWVWKAGTMPAMTQEARDALLHEAALAYGRAARLLDPMRLRLWEERDIAFPQLRLLLRIRMMPDIDLRSLADAVSISPSAASQQVDKLVERGFVARSDDPQDRRRVRLSLTASGEEAIGEYSRAATEYTTLIVSGLSEGDQRELVRLLQALVDLNNPPPPLPVSRTTP
jgi:DNA-binding MarR family transcriptional regulator